MIPEVLEQDTRVVLILGILQSHKPLKLNTGLVMFTNCY
jgi:hypothetical protein